MSIHFQQENSPFAIDLKGRVDAYFQTNRLSRYATPFAWLKGLLFAIAFTTCYACLYHVVHIWQVLLIYSVMGMCKIFLALNVAHDAAHNAFSSKKRINDLLLFTFDLLGASGYMWKIRHVFSHHPYANIPEYDADIKQSNLVRIFPDAVRLPIHAYQHIYMPVLYGFYSIHWLVFRDFVDFSSTPTNTRKIKKHTKAQWFRLLGFKATYFTLFLLIPFYVSDFQWWTVWGFMLMHVVASYTVAIALASAHVGEEAVFPVPDGNGKMYHSYSKHQLLTTTDFATDSLLITQLYGAFNHHVIHHLYPNICHIHYPALTGILIDTCREHGLKYQQNPSLSASISSHWKLLRERAQEHAPILYPEF